MKKYLQAAKTIFKSQLIWRFDVGITVLSPVIKIIFASILWGSIFAVQGQVSVFTFSTMMSYYLVHAFLIQIDSSAQISSEISLQVRNGTFSKYMVVPVNTQAYFCAQAAGRSFFFLFFALPVSALWIWVFKIPFTVSQEPQILGAAVVMALAGLVFMAQFHYFLGILTFRFQDIRFFLIIQENLMSFITGAFVPLALLPGAVQRGMQLFPFYYTAYLPTMLLIGQSNFAEAVKGIVILLLWNILLLWGNRKIYEASRIRFDGVGI